MYLLGHLIILGHPEAYWSGKIQDLCDRIMLTKVAHRNLDLNGCNPSALPLSYPTIPSKTQLCTAAKLSSSVISDLSMNINGGGKLLVHLLTVVVSLRQ